MNVSQKLISYYHLLRCGFHGDTHANRLDSFYRQQAEHYDETRQNICPERDRFYQEVAATGQWQGKVWVDIGGGTGAALDFIPDEVLSGLAQLVIVDLTPSLLQKARQKVAQRGLQNVTLIEADAAQFSLADVLPEHAKADIVSFCYSLTMMPDWWRMVSNAERQLADDGTFAITDFYVSQRVAAKGRTQHGWFTREVLPTIFAVDHVMLSRDHLPYLLDRFDTEAVYEGMHALSGFRWLKRPFYRFIGRKRKHCG